ncbi:MAG: ABC transporter permease [Alphaproteobacteria bacterium]|nr:ABC transporter permease [Pseudomonadota bacterium]
MKNTPQQHSALAETASVRIRRSRWHRTRILLSRAPLTAWFGMMVVVIYAFVTLFAPMLAPYGEAEVFSRGDAPWSKEHLLGTDRIGRDVLTRLLYGARNTVGIALGTTMFAFVVGGGLGLIAAINRSWLDQLISRAVDTIMAIPGLIFALMLLAIFGASILSLILIVGITYATNFFRLTRSVSLNVVVMDYVEAARLRGENMAWIMTREILPNILPPLIAEFGLRFIFVFLFIASLSFLGMGIQPPTADWGSMVRENAHWITFVPFVPFQDAVFYALKPLLPAGCIALLTIGVNFIVDWFIHETSGLRDV